MSDRGYSRERDAARARRRSPISPRASRSPTPPRRYSRSPSNHRARGNSRSRRSPAASSRRQPFVAHRENPSPSTVLGVFGLSQYSTERDLKDMFHKFGRIKDIQIVMDKKTNKSRGFGFVYFEDVDSAARAKDALNATELDHHRLRIDFSVTKRAHTPTPGIYMGVRTTSYHRANGSSSYRRSPSPDRKPPHRRHHHHHRHHHHSPRSPSRTRSRSRSRRGGDRRRRSPGYPYD